MTEIRIPERIETINCVVFLQKWENRQPKVKKNPCTYTYLTLHRKENKSSSFKLASSGSSILYLSMYTPLYHGRNAQWQELLDSQRSSSTIALLFSQLSPPTFLLNSMSYLTGGGLTRNLNLFKDRCELHSPYVLPNRTFMPTFQYQTCSRSQAKYHQDACNSPHKH